jgi:hypothetical protein
MVPTSASRAGAVAAAGAGEFNDNPADPAVRDHAGDHWYIPAGHHEPQER